MPRRDGTGPAGMGPLSGRGKGFCHPAGAPCANRPAWGMGRAWRRGFGRGFGFAAASTPQLTKEDLKEQKKWLQGWIGEIDQQLSEPEEQ